MENVPICITQQFVENISTHDFRDQQSLFNFLENNSTGNDHRNEREEQQMNPVDRSRKLGILRKSKSSEKIK